MNRKVMTLQQVREMVEDGVYDPELDGVGICGLIEVENMGWCKDGCTRWYTFEDYDGEPCIYFKHGDKPKYN